MILLFFREYLPPYQIYQLRCDNAKHKAFWHLIPKNGIDENVLSKLFGYSLYYRTLHLVQPFYGHLISPTVHQKIVKARKSKNYLQIPMNFAVHRLYDYEIIASRFHFKHSSNYFGAWVETIPDFTDPTEASRALSGPFHPCSELTKSVFRFTGPRKVDPCVSRDD